MENQQPILITYANIMAVLPSLKYYNSVAFLTPEALQAWRKMTNILGPDKTKDLLNEPTKYAEIIQNYTNTATRYRAIFDYVVKTGTQILCIQEYNQIFHKYVEDDGRFEIITIGYINSADPTDPKNLKNNALATAILIRKDCRDRFEILKAEPIHNQFTKMNNNVKEVSTRAITFVVIQDKGSGHQFIIVSWHLAGYSRRIKNLEETKIKAEPGLTELKFWLEKIDELRQSYPLATVVVGGDLNESDKKHPFAHYTDSEFMEFSRIALMKEKGYIMHTTDYPSEILRDGGDKGGQSIDWVGIKNFDGLSVSAQGSDWHIGAMDDRKIADSHKLLSDHAFMHCSILSSI